MSAQDTVSIQQLVCREREARDRCWWAEMRSTFAPEGVVSLSWYQGDAKGFVDGSIRMAQGGSSSTHKLGPVVVRVIGMRALATVSATIEARTSIEGVEADLLSDTRLLYRAAQDSNGQWKLVSLTCIYEKDRIVTAVPGEKITIAAEDLAKYRSTYRCLSFVLESRGFPVNQELVGDDRPEGVTKLYDEAFEWLRDAGGGQ